MKCNVFLKFSKYFFLTRLRYPKTPADLWRHKQSKGRRRFMARFVRLGYQQSWTGVFHEDIHNNKLSYNCEENPELGNNHRYVKFLSVGSIVQYSLVSCRSQRCLEFARVYIKEKQAFLFRFKNLRHFQFLQLKISPFSGALHQ